MGVDFVMAFLSWCFRLFILASACVGDDPSCFFGEFSGLEEQCCDISKGPRGDPECWDELGFDFVRCCRVASRPEIHFISFGIADWRASALASSVELLTGRRLEIFGIRDDKNPPPISWNPELSILFKKILLTKRTLDALPDEDYVLYMD